MPLTLAQLQALKADIIAASDPAMQALEATPTHPDLALAVAVLYNAQASPAYTVWKTNVALGDVGNKFNAAELAGLTSLNTQRLQNVAAWLESGVNPSLSAVRQFFDDIFSGASGTLTRAALLVLWKRLATRAEKLFATGTGSDAEPATLNYEGPLSGNDVLQAMQS